MKRLSTSQAAFTIIEVVLFLAISSGLTVIALNGLRGRNEAVQFNQGVRLLESLVQEQLALVTNGQFSDGLTCPGGPGQCLFLGRVIEFTEDSTEVLVHVVVGDRFNQSAPVPSESPAQTLAQTQPRVLTTERKDIDWGIVFDGGYEVAGLEDVSITPGQKRLVGYLRLPTSTDIVPIAYAIDGATFTDAAAVIASPTSYTTATRSSFNSNFEGRFCFLGREGDFAQLQFGQDSRKQGIDLVFEEDFEPGRGC